MCDALIDESFVSHEFSSPKQLSAVEQILKTTINSLVTLINKSIVQMLFHCFYYNAHVLVNKVYLCPYNNGNYVLANNVYLCPYNNGN